MKSVKISALLFSLAIIAGCGGSSSSSSPSVPTASKISITTSNKNLAYNAAISASRQDMGSSFASFAGGVQTSSSGKDRALRYAADYAIDKMNRYPVSTTNTVTGASSSVNCGVSGNITVDTDSSGSTFNGTYIKITESNCQDTANGPVGNGYFNITGITNSTTTFSATFDFNLTISQNGSTLLSLLGGFTLSETGKKTASQVDAIKGTGITLKAGTVTFGMTNMDISETYNNNGTTPVTYSENVNFSVAFIDSNPSNSQYNFSFDIATITPVAFTDTVDVCPHSGQFVIKGDQNTALRVTFLPTSGSNVAGTSTGQIKLEISTDGGVTYPTADASTVTCGTGTL